MHTEDSPLERTPDLVAKIRALRQQAEKEMDRFTDPGDYDIRRVAGKKPKAERTDVLPVVAEKKKRGKKAEQTSIDFTSAPEEHSADDEEQQ